MDTKKSSATRGTDSADFPARMSREIAARVLSKHFFEVSPRTLERWPVAWRQLNGKAHAETSELFAHAESVLAAAPIIMGGRRAQAEQSIA